MSLRIYNSLSKQIEDFEPLNPQAVTMYTCGPTVYLYNSIGNFRTYAFSDFVHRVLLFNQYKVNYIMNLTDVGHLTGDNLGDADTGKDRIEETAEKEGRSAREIADYYIEDFMQSYDKLNLLHPKKFTRATDYINEQIELVRTLEMKGFTYKISDGVYFDTSKFEDYGKLAGLKKEEMQEGARVEPNREKRNPADFALWKFSVPSEKRWQEWDTPWGMGFPGWHLECSAMAMKELGDSIDLHLGGEDLKMIHHPNEIAQSECASGKQFAKYWMHGAFLQVDGGRMGRSLDNVYTLGDIQDKGYEPMALRYLYMTSHYRGKLNFTWEALQNAQNSLKKMYDLVAGYKSEEGAEPSDRFLGDFEQAINDDVNIPQALAVAWETLKSDLNEATKLVTVLKMDQVLGLRLEDYVGFEVPQKVIDLAETRVEYRKNGIWDKADLLRRQLEELGYIVEDQPGNKFKLKRKL